MSGRLPRNVWPSRFDPRARAVDLRRRRLPPGHPYKGSGVVFKGETEEADVCMHETVSAFATVICHRPRADHQ